MTRTAEEYAGILAELMEVNRDYELPNDLLSVAVGIAQMFNEQVVHEAFDQIGEGADLVSTLMTIPAYTPAMMFKLGVLYGRKEAADLLTSE